MIKPKLELLKGSVLQGSRYLYNEHLLFNGTYCYGGTGTIVDADEKYDIELSLIQRTLRGQDFGETYKTVTLHRGEPIGMLLALTYNDNYQYTKHTTSSAGYINETENGPKLEIIY